MHLTIDRLVLSFNVRFFILYLSKAGALEFCKHLLMFVSVDDF